MWFISDTHFGHSKLLELQAHTRVKSDGSPFESVEEHDEYLIERWNHCVGKKDLVFHLGDVAFLSKKELQVILARLNGQICLIAGNHDGKHIRNAKGWAWVKDMYELKFPHIDTGQEQRIMLCHYPMITWKGAHKGSWHLHGHCHGNLRAVQCKACGHHPDRWPGRRLDMGVDEWRMRPVEISEVTARMKEITYEQVDHHVEK